MTNLEYLLSVWEDDGGRGWVQKNYNLDHSNPFGKREPTNKELYMIEREEDLMSQIEICYERLETFREQQENIFSDSFHDRVLTDIIDTHIDAEVRKLLELEIKLVDIRR